jgi:hypothetical protein
MVPTTMESITFILIEKKKIPEILRLDMKKDITIHLMFMVMLNTCLKIRTVYTNFLIHLIKCYNMLKFPDNKITPD